MIIFTDGAAAPTNPGPGGYAAIILHPTGEQEIVAGGFQHTTNQRAEVYAAIAAIESLPLSTSATIISDSSYLVTGYNVWLPNWRLNRWRKSNKKPVDNLDLWKRLIAACAGRKISFKWIKRESDPLNIKADAIANKATTGKNLPVDEGYERRLAA
jgi:ribonuclease HI